MTKEEACDKLQMAEALVLEVSDELRKTGQGMNRSDKYYPVIWGYEALVRSVGDSIFRLREWAVDSPFFSDGAWKA